MQQTVATQLLKIHAPKIQIVEKNAQTVHLMSMQAYGSSFLRSFIEEHNPPQSPRLLHTIPEEELVHYAEKHDILVVKEEKDDVRHMLDRIAAQQPQTYFSLARSAWRLKDAADALREE